MGEGVWLRKMCARESGATSTSGARCTRRQRILSVNKVSAKYQKMTGEIIDMTATGAIQPPSIAPSKGDATMR